MIQHMTERLAGKIGNANNNAFMLRKLFKMYDTANTGQVSRCGFMWSHRIVFCMQQPGEGCIVVEEKASRRSSNCDHTQAVNER